MKAHNKLLVLASVMLLCSTAFAQRSDWTLGFRLGYKGEVLEKTMFLVNPEFEIKTGIVPTFLGLNVTCDVGLDVTYNIDKKFSVTSGIGYLNYCAFWRTEERTNMPESVTGYLFFDYLQIPLNAKYAIPFGKSNFSVYGKMGISLNILVDEENTYPERSKILYPPISSSFVSSPYYYEYKHTAKIYDKKINVLFNAGIGFSYRFKNGLGLFAEGEYYAGLRTIGHVSIDIKQSSIFTPDILNEYQEFLLVKGSYWNCSLGISYTFKKKEKKE